MKSEYGGVMICFVQGFDGSLCQQNQIDKDNGLNEKDTPSKDELPKRRSILGIGRDSKRSKKKAEDDKICEEKIVEALPPTGGNNNITFKRSLSEKPEFTRRFGASLIRKTRSSGNFSSGPGSLLGVTSGPGGAAPRSAPSTPHQQLEAPPRSPSHSVTKYDKNNKSSWSANEGVGASDGALAAPPSGSKARQKKFNRHFPQAAQDERVLNHYSCALVGDILLQGHLYITKNYFAFYSNVFGYVTKLLIPTATVVRISKEKLGRIIPNAVGVQTSEDKHVFGSLLSRDTTYKLMTQVWKDSPGYIAETVSKELQTSRVEDASEISPDDESSCSSQSAAEESNEVNSAKGTRLIPVTRTCRTPSPRSGLTESTNSPTPGDEAPSEKSKIKSSKIANENDKNSSSPTVVQATVTRKTTGTIISQNGSAFARVSKRTRSSSDAKITPTVMDALPKHSTLLIIATVLLIVLFFSAGLLLYRIGIVRDKLGSNFALEDNVLFLKRGDDFYGEILKWQSQLHSKSAMQVHDFLHSNLEQIAKVRQSLETLSTLIGGVTNDNSKLSIGKNSDNTFSSDKTETIGTMGIGQSSNNAKS